MSRPRHVTPTDLAEEVRRALVARGTADPGIGNLIELFQTLMGVSYATEEAVPIRVQVVWVDPNNPDPDVPPHIRDDRWRWFPLEGPIPLSASTLAKLALASDPRSTSIAVFGQHGRILASGLIDQQTLMHNFLYREGTRLYAAPGTFQARVEGVAHIRVYDGPVRIAELHGDELVSQPVDVLGSGPIREKLMVGAERHIDAILGTLSGMPASTRREWRSEVSDSYFAVLSRTLLRIESYRHGGGLIIAQEASATNLNVKYKLSYDRLNRSFDSAMRQRISVDEAYEHINNTYFREQADDMAVLAWLDYEVPRDELEDAESAIDGASRFISLLTRVDGAVLLDPLLNVKSFGAEIVVNDIPPVVVIARNPHATVRRRTIVDYNHFGTRHRSMMRYCWSVPDSVGFVVSHDGGVRAITRVGDDVVTWPEIQLHHEVDYRRKIPQLPMSIVKSDLS